MDVLKFRCNSRSRSRWSLHICYEDLSHYLVFFTSSSAQRKFVGQTFAACSPLLGQYTNPSRMSEVVCLTVKSEDCLHRPHFPHFPHLSHYPHVAHCLHAYAHCWNGHLVYAVTILIHRQQ